MSKLHELIRNDGSHYAWLFWCPACACAHQCDNRWGFNGNQESPTFTGSVLVHECTHGTPEEPIHRPRCHSQVTDGKIRFYPDSQHLLAEQTVDLPDWPPGPRTDL